ncbi:hypothetical protein [Sphingobacterium sp. IITKGP-BTPF85]|uniref:hypothetical protein n=1 Tax=Sphingobacterium sp. IITKGP-BTPF85 TaxID=1338009 RepID=UPI00038A3255|nr:hypothetical protein [Sphingobacterium sp. IITKGP-BTPF85]KKX51795.1 hypothetical protein L950_0203160 [Sphingobacterium sp. IITKGP-BTPF85]
MGNPKIRIKRPSLAEQYIALKRAFPESLMESDMITYFTWEGTLRSSPLGDEYLIKINYTLGNVPKIYVIGPKVLKLALGKDRLPHVYKQKEQQLCLFVSSEWNTGRMIAYTIIPWIIEWLFHYELWLIDGDWKGGGTEH